MTQPGQEMNIKEFNNANTFPQEASIQLQSLETELAALNEQKHAAKNIALHRNK